MSTSTFGRGFLPGFYINNSDIKELIVGICSWVLQVGKARTEKEMAKIRKVQRASWIGTL
jgi:hypothetical protein